MNDREEKRVLFVGDDWAEAHHDVEIVDENGRVLARRRLPEGVAGIEALHALIADHLGDDDEVGDVVIGIETDRGPWVQALIAAGYVVFAINPVQAARYRQRHSTSGAKSACRLSGVCISWSCASRYRTRCMNPRTASASVE